MIDQVPVGRVGVQVALPIGSTPAVPVTGAPDARVAENVTGPLGKPVIKGNYAFHIENHRLVSCLESIARRNGVEFADDTLDRAETANGQVTALHFKSGETRTADLYVDASGFRAELIGKALEEPFKSFSSGLFCDRAVIGGWERTDEPILPYTTAETMDAGWAWQIEHETFINRGYVYGSAFISDEDAQAELLAKNPEISTTHTPAHGVIRGKGNDARAKEVKGNGTKFVGYRVEVLDGEKIVGELGSTPQNLRKESK